MSKIAFTLTAALFAIAAGQSSQFDSSGSAEFRDPDTDLTEDRSAGDVSPSMGKKGKKGKTASDDQEGLNRIGDEITVGKGKGKSMGKGKSGTGGPDAIDRIGDGGTLLAKSAKGKSSKSDADAGDGGVLDRGGSGDIGGSGDRGVSGSGADKIVSIVQTTAASSPSGKKTGKSSGKKKSFKSVGSLRAATATTGMKLNVFS